MLTVVASARPEYDPALQTLTAEIPTSAQKGDVLTALVVHASASGIILPDGWTDLATVTVGGLTARKIARMFDGTEGDSLVVATVAAKTLTKTGATGSWDGGASSVETFAGDGYLEFTVDDTDKDRAIGISDADSSTDHSDILYAWYFTGGGGLQVRESGAIVVNFGVTFAAGDTFRIERTGSTVRYYQNGALKYTSLVPNGNPLRIDSALYTTAGDFRGIKLVDDGVPVNITWQNIAGATATTDADEIQGSLLVLRGGGSVPLLVEASASLAFAATMAPGSPAISSLQAINLAIEIWSTSGSPTLTPPTGFDTIDTYSTSLMSARTLLVASKRVNATGALTLGAAGSSVNATGSAFAMMLRDGLPMQPAELVDLVPGNIGLLGKDNRPPRESA